MQVNYINPNREHTLYNHDGGLSYYNNEDNVNNPGKDAVNGMVVMVVEADAIHMAKDNCTMVCTKPIQFMIKNPMRMKM
jgi:mitochondrial fission protein ELM1